MSTTNSTNIAFGIENDLLFIAVNSLKKVNSTALANHDSQSLTCYLPVPLTVKDGEGFFGSSQLTRRG